MRSSVAFSALFDPFCEALCDALEDARTDQPSGILIALQSAKQAIDFIQQQLALHPPKSDLELLAVIKQPSKHRIQRLPRLHAAYFSDCSTIKRVQNEQTKNFLTDVASWLYCLTIKTYQLEAALEQHLYTHVSKDCSNAV